MTQIVLYSDHEHTEGAPLSLTWSEIAELLSEPRETACEPCSGKDCLAKFGDAWSPVDIVGKRADANVRAVTVAVVDLDDIGGPELEKLAESIDGYEYVLHSTHSHRMPDEKHPADDRQRFRLVLPLSRPALPKEWRSILPQILKALGVPIAIKANKLQNRAGKGGADGTCKDVSRLYFLPSHCEGRDFIYETGSGDCLDVDALLASAKASAPAAEPTRADAGEEPGEETDEEPGPVDLAELRACLVNSKRAKASSIRPDDKARYNMLSAVLAGTPLAVPGERDDGVNKAASYLAFCLPEGTPVEAAIELLRPSIAAMDYSEGSEDLDHFLKKAEHNFSRAADRRAQRDADKAALDRKVLERAKARASARETSPKASGKADATEGGEDPQGEESYDVELGATALAQDTGGDWTDLLVKQAGGKTLACGANVVIALTHCPAVKGTIRWDDVGKRITVHGGPFAKVNPEVLESAVSDWLVCQPEWGFNAGDTTIGSRILRVARENAYDPIREYLLGLEWDGVERCGSFLKEHCRAVSIDEHDGTDISEHVARVSANFLTSIAARGLQPGRKVDTVLVLEGHQGLKKSSALKALGGEHFAATQLDVTEKATKMLAGSSWIIELAELVSFKRGESLSQKAFFTQEEDKFLLPYARTISASPRRAVFIGTTNDDEYLVDKTGNRRYWPIFCRGPRIDVKGIEAIRDQLFAEATWRASEAMRLQDAGTPDEENPTRWWLLDDEEAIAAKQVAARVADSYVEAKISDWWAALSPEQRPKALTTHYVAENVLKYASDRLPNRALECEIGAALKALRFAKKRPMLNGKQTWAYVPTAALLDAPTVKRRSGLAAVPRAAGAA